MVKIIFECNRKNEKYESLKKTICIWIIDGSVYNEIKKYHTTWKIKETELGIVGHFDDLEFHIIELSKFRKLDIMKPSKKEFWLWFIDYTRKEMVKMACENNKRVAEARETLDKIHADKELMDLIRRQEMFERDQISALSRSREEGEKIGMAKGEKLGIEKGEKLGLTKGKKEIAKKLKLTDMPISQIAEITELTEKEIEEL